ncbi:MAG: flagellar basal body rod protein FlgB [Bacillota bacterium]|jgi:flagellar basal-body rod protein FlgB|nr:flagellar basal body rod protein FlgB [Candidatus Fermentithermobacillaceae bacterium]
MKDVSLIMQRALDGAWRRHEVLANNVANAETPGYKRLDLDFRTALAEASAAKRPTLVATSPRHIVPSNTVEPGCLGQDLSAITPDGNSVDIDREMGEVAANALYYSAVSGQLRAHLSLLRKAITEGRR